MRQTLTPVGGIFSYCSHPPVAVSKSSMKDNPAGRLKELLLKTSLRLRTLRGPYAAVAVLEVDTKITELVLLAGINKATATEEVKLVVLVAPEVHALTPFKATLAVSPHNWYAE